MTVLFCWCTLSSDILLSLFMQDLDNNGYIGDEELHKLLKKAGHDMPGYMVRDIIKKLDRDNDKLISFDEFLSVRSSERRIPVWYRLFRTSRALGPGLFCLRPQRTSRSSNEQMCVFAPTCVHPGKVEKHARRKNVEARSLKWFCVPVLAFSCVLKACIPSFCYRSESFESSRTSYFTFQV